MYKHINSAKTGIFKLSLKRKYILLYILYAKYIKNTTLECRKGDLEMKQEFDEEVFEDQIESEDEMEEEDDEQSILEHSFRRGYEEETLDPNEEAAPNEDMEY